MPFHLELGSDGHSFHGKAIVVNSITGRHLSHSPIPIAKAEAQKRVVEQAVAEHGEHVTASGKPDGRRKKVKADPPPAPVPEPKMKSKGTPLPPAEAKRLLAQLAERKREARIAKMKHIEPKMSMMKEEVHHGGDTSISPIKAKAVNKSGEITEKTERALKADPFLVKCYGDGEYMDKFIDQLKLILAGDKKDRSASLSRDYNRDVFDLGLFYSHNFPKNANNKTIPAKTAKLISSINPKWELLIMGTGDYDAWGKYEDVVMALLA